MHESSPVGSPAYPALGLPARFRGERLVAHESRLWGGSPGRHVTLYHGKWAPGAAWNVWVDTGYMASGDAAVLDGDLADGATWLATELYLNVLPARAELPPDAADEWRWRQAQRVDPSTWQDITIPVDGEPEPFRVMRADDGAWVATWAPLPRVVHVLGWGVEPGSLELVSVTRLSAYSPLAVPWLAAR
jgi:hypothetical protein